MMKIDIKAWPQPDTATAWLDLLQGAAIGGDDAASHLPLVAIATPVYNGARFLAETMASVQAQTYPNLVHVVLDNASTDETPHIIDCFRNSRIPLITARNEKTIPQTDNWNAVLRMIPPDTKYFRILPADDLIMPEFTEKLVMFGEEHPEVAIIGCREFENDKLRDSDMPPKPGVFDGKAIVRASLRYHIVGFPHLHSLCRMPEGGLPEPFYEPECYGTPLECFDTDANMRILSEGSYGWVPDPLVMNREHATSVTSQATRPNGLKLWADLQHLDRWGPAVFKNAAHYRKCRKKQLRFYYRNMLMWHALGNRKLIEMHRDLLRRASASPSIANYVMAAAEWPFLRAARSLARLAVRLGVLRDDYRIQ